MLFSLLFFNLLENERFVREKKKREVERERDKKRD